MTLQEIKVRDQVNKILYKESETHNRVTNHRNGQKSYYTSIGYYSEDAFLGDCMEWMRLKYPFLKNFVFHIPNEGYSGDKAAKIAASQQVTKGVLPGVFDLLSVWKGHEWGEAKLLGEDWSHAQKVLLPLWAEKGIIPFKFDTFELFIYWIEKIVLR